MNWGNLKAFIRHPLSWLLILIILASTAGAAVGTVLMGKIDAQINVTVGQAIKVYKPQVTTETLDPWPKAWFSSVKDDLSSFSVAVEASQGDIFIIFVPLENQGEQDIVVEMTLIPDPAAVGNITLLGVSGSGVIEDVVQVDNFLWKFTLDGNAAGGNDGVKIRVKIKPTALPGFYKLEGSLRPVAY